MKPVLPLSESEMSFWPVLSRSRKIAWDRNLNMLACVTCRDLAMMVEISVSDCGEDLLPELCQRTHKGLLLLGIGEVTGDSLQHRIVKEFQAGI